ncbi:YlbF family regulator [Paenibacillaceae bacterium WGS1546]|uniref:YlbF family regulator n=1 Tax=Cohnella sp. WGS1546 TaxID=3366810 RepID=UPI00372D5B5E
MAGITHVLPAAEREPAEREPADLGLLLSRAYELGDSLNRSACAAEYAYWKARLVRDAEAQRRSRKFAEAKEKFAECERFGRFHPDYHAALDSVREAQRALDELETVREFKAAENALDELLYDISRTLAHAVSHSIKVPDNDPNPKASGCGNGGSCSCGSGGCG